MAGMSFLFSCGTGVKRKQPREVLGALIDNDATLSVSKTTSDAASLASSKSKRDEDLRPWIENMKSWMRQRAIETDRLLARSRNEDDAFLTSEWVLLCSDGGN